MDPVVWGPLAWAFVMDICWQIQQRGYTALTDRNKKAVNIFFSSLQYLLPCVYCRASYTGFINEMKMTPLHNGNESCSNALNWAYNLKNKVNHKLQQQQQQTINCITMEKLEKRMKTYESMSSMQGLLDFLFIIAANYDADVDNPDKSVRREKKAWFWALVTVLPDLLSMIKCFSPLERELRKRVIQHKDVETKDSVLAYLCHIYDGALPIEDGNNSIRVPQNVCAKYNNAKSSNKAGTVDSPR